MGYRVTPLRLDVHRDALARLWAENMSEPRIAAVVPDRIRWLYEQRPEGPATTVLCVDSGSGDVVGCGSFYDRATWLRGRRLRAGVLCDFAVVRAHRNAGAAVAIQRGLVDAATARGLELLYGHPNEKSVAVFQRVGYRLLGHTSAWAKPLATRHRLREVLGWKGAATAAAAPFDAVLGALDRVHAARIPLRVRGEPIAEDDPRVAALWRRACSRCPVVGEQSTDYLAWRYRRFTTAAYRTFGVFPPDEGRLLGFAVYTLQGRKALLGDVFAEDLESCLEPLLVQLGRHLRSEGADSVTLSYIGSQAFHAALLALGFLPRPGRRPVVVHPGGLDEPTRAQVQDPANWFMLEGELDI